MTPANSDLARVLAALDRTPGECKPGIALDCADAARLLREMAADFARFAAHNGAFCDSRLTQGACLCGLDAARARWRLPE